jgi:hypothetical protein
VDQNSYFRASTALAKDLRDFQACRRQYVVDHVDPYRVEFPQNSPWMLLLEEKVVGFTDDAPHLPPPAGLSRSSRRDYLIPLTGKIGARWRERLDLFNNKLPKSSDVWKKHDIPRDVLRGDSIYLTHYVDFGPGNLIVITGGIFEPIPIVLSPLRTSEFFLLKEEYEDAHSDWHEQLRNYP